MPTYTYLNETVISNSELAGVKGSNNSRVLFKIERQDYILDQYKTYNLSVEMFHLHKVRIPLFKPSFVNYKVGILNTTTNVTEFRDVDFSSFVEDDGFMYDYRDVATAINETINYICDTTLSIPALDIPTFNFNKQNLRFEINSTSNFRDDYAIVFNDDLRTDFNSFEFDRLDDEYEMIVLSGDVETQDSGTIEFLSPIARIVLESQNLPVAFELMPPDNSNTTISKNSSVFITDYKYIQKNNQDIQSILFESKSTDHRFHNVLQNNFSSFNLFFTMYDYKNNKYPLKLLPQSIVQIKLLFQSDR